MDDSKTIGRSALSVTLGVIAVFAIFVVYLVYDEYELFEKSSVETLFRFVIMTVCVVIAIGFFWGFFVSKITNESNRILSFLKSSSCEDSLDADSFQTREFRQIALQINSMLATIKDKNRELNELNQNLEKKVKIKTADLEKALSSRDKFIKDSIHEINTPLAVIQANIDLIRLGKNEAKHLVKIEAATKIIINIYEDLSYFVKKERFIVKKEVMDLSDFLRQRVDYFKEAAYGASLTINTSIEPQMFVYFDKTQLQRVLDNNIFNAVKYSKEGMSIDIKLFSDDKGKIVFEVVNQSLYKPDIQAIFDRFYRGVDARGGFGIGLSLVYQIASQNGVKICCASLEDGRMWFAYAFRDYLEDAFRAHGF